VFESIRADTRLEHPTAHDCDYARADEVMSMREGDDAEPENGELSSVDPVGRERSGRLSLAAARVLKACSACVRGLGRDTIPQSAKAKLRSTSCGGKQVPGHVQVGAGPGSPLWTLPLFFILPPPITSLFVARCSPHNCTLLASIISSCHGLCLAQILRHTLDLTSSSRVSAHHLKDDALDKSPLHSPVQTR
jgi:hypothetical protein